jgi:Zn finger protein HypA/HybF involved in hydrogenase expression
MSKSEFPPISQLTPIERLRCSQCTSRMMLAGISPGPIGFEPRLFECPKCDSVQNEVVAACGSPMKLTAIEPSAPGQDLRTFACPRCNRVQRHIIESTVTVAWLVPKK